MKTTTISRSRIWCGTCRTRSFLILWLRIAILLILLNAILVRLRGRSILIRMAVKMDRRVWDIRGLWFRFRIDFYWKVFRMILLFLTRWMLRNWKKNRKISIRLGSIVRVGKYWKVKRTSISWGFGKGIRGLSKIKMIIWYIWKGSWTKSWNRNVHLDLMYLSFHYLY